MSTRIPNSSWLSLWLDFFFKKPKSKRATEIWEDLEQVNLESDDSDEELAVEETVVDDQVEQDDKGQIEHDQGAVKSSCDQAILDMDMEYGVKMTAAEECTALKIFPAVKLLII